MALNRCAFALAVVLVAGTATAQLIVDSDGSDGALNPPGPNTLFIDLAQAATGDVCDCDNDGFADDPCRWDCPSPVPGNGIYDPEKWAVVFKYSSVTLASNRSVGFYNHPSGAPVVWLVQGNVTINGNLFVHAASSAASFCRPGESTCPGPGGFRGGDPAIQPNEPSGGRGPGGGDYVSAGAYAAGSFASAGGKLGLAPVASIYGNAELLPLIGGSGGAAHGDISGTHGGGAILIAGGGTITVNGLVLGTGLGGFSGSAGGSGGGLRLVANTIVGSGTLRFEGNGATNTVGGNGRVRLEAMNPIGASFNITGAVTSQAIINNPPEVWPSADAPSLNVVSLTYTDLVGQEHTVPVPPDPRARFSFPDADASFLTDNPVTFNLSASNVPLDWVVTARLVPKSGPTIISIAQPLVGTPMGSATTLTVTVPKGFAAAQFRAAPVVPAVDPGVPVFTDVVSREFSTHRLSPDLAVSGVATTPATLSEQPFTLSWTVSNVGQRTATGRWFDQVILSPDSTLGNANDVILACFANPGDVAQGGNYLRVEQVCLPEGLLPGSYYLFVRSDVSDTVAEQISGSLFEVNNNQALAVSVASSFAPVASCTPRPECVLADVPGFHVEIYSQGLSNPAFMSIAQDGTVYMGREIPPQCCTPARLLQVGLGGSPIREYAATNIPDPDAPLVDDEGRISGVPGAVLVGAGNSIVAVYPDETVTTLYAGGVLSNVSQMVFDHDGRLILTDDDPLAPGVGRLNQSSGGTPSLLASVNCEPGWPRDCMSEWVAISPSNEIYSWWTDGWIRVHRADGVLLNDSFVKLSPWLGSGNPPYGAQMAFGPGNEFGSDLFAHDASTDNIYRIDAFGAIHEFGRGFVGSTLLFGPDGAMYMAEETKGRILRIAPDSCTLLSEFEPRPNSDLVVGSEITLSGRVVVPGRSTASVSINSQIADSFDTWGRFFHRVRIEDFGQNCFTILATLETGVACTKAVCFNGVALPQPEFDETSDVTRSIHARYSNTSYNPHSRTFVTHVAAVNGAAGDIDAPIMLVVESISDATVKLVNLDGVTDDGRPYVLVVDPMQRPVLHAGEQSDAHVLAFSNPNGVPVRFTISWRAIQNHAPIFVTIPTTQSAEGASYRYRPAAEDPDGHAVTLAIEVAPSTMSYALGELAWQPSAADVGSHSVSILATDTRGGRTRQSFVVEVLPLSANRPPVFTSSPPTHVATGADYAYRVTVSDPDSDSVDLALLDGPTGLAFDPLDSSLLEWDYALPDSAECPVSNCIVTVYANDGRGGVATQTFVLTVGNTPSNPNSPRLFGTPSIEASVGGLYLYQPTATDPDVGDVLEFDLPIAPAGMQIDPATGRVTWTPTAAQAGPQSVRLRVRDRDGVDGVFRGSATTQDWTINVSTTFVNRPPVILSVPSLFAKVNAPYKYQIEAADPEGFQVAFQLVSPPPGMTISPGGQVSWTPTTQGIYTIAVKATDPQGKFGSQAYSLQVYPVNTNPVIQSTPPSGNVVAGTVYRYDVDAADPDGDSVTYFLAANRPSGMVINPGSGLITWQPDASYVGQTVVFTVQARDSFGGIDSEVVSAPVVADTIPPEVEIVFTVQPANVGEQMLVCVQGGDNVGIASRTLTADGVPIAVEGFGCAPFIPDSAGLVAFEATVADPSGNSDVATKDLLIIDPNADQPEITLVSPTLPATITGPTPIKATITDPLVNELSVVRVTIRPAESQEEQTIAELHNIPPFALPTELAVIDPTNRPNGDYVVSILAFGANAGGVQFPISITGDFKLGNFTMTFTDLALPVAGIPLVVSRTYDSLDTSKGDFGAGWRLGLPGKLADSAADSATASEMGNSAFVAGTRVYVTKPDGRRVGFTFAPVGAGGLFGSIFGYLVRPEFRADDGVTDKLTALNAPTYVWYVGGEFLDYYIPFNPRLYRLTTKEGLKYDIDEFDGLKRSTDVNGNTIDVTPGGLISSTGLSLVFQRDGQGRITRITEPDANPSDADPPGFLQYIYDATGNLKFFRDLSGAETEYFYKQGDPRYVHYLEKIEDPLNRPVLRNYFDDDGRLVAVCDASANPNPPDYAGCTTFDHAVVPGGTTSTVINARGCRSILEFDDRGNVVRELRWLDDNLDDDFDCKTGVSSGRWLETVREYDAKNNLLFETSPPTADAPNGYTWSFAYDSRGNQLTREDPGGRVWTYTYNDCNKVTSETDPMGNMTTYQYDEFCNLRFVIDALGGVTEYRYNDRGQRTHFIDAVVWNGVHPNVWQFHYDANGYPSGFTDPLGHSATTHFNERGELQYSIDRRGWRIDFDYDDAHRVTLERWQPNIGAPEQGDLANPRDTTYTYNAAGQIETAIDPDSALTITYFPMGLLETVDNVGTPGAPRVRIDYIYDANGNVISVTDRHGPVAPIGQGITEYIYDSLDRLTRLQQFGVNGAAVNEKRVDMEYDDANAQRALRRFADLGASQAVANTFYEYDCGVCPSRLSAIRHRKASDSSVIHDLEFDRDALGNIHEMRDTEGMHRYTYDGLRRLLLAYHPVGGPQPDEFYTYDAVGNRLSSHLSSRYEYAYQASPTQGGNAIRNDQDRSYAHDRNGNLTAVVHHSFAIQRLLRYDHRNRLVAIIEDPGGNNPTTAPTTFTYDAVDRRIAVTEDGHTAFVSFDGQNPFIRTSPLSDVIERRLFGRTLDHILVQEYADGTSWLLPDHIGTTRTVIDNAENIVNSYAYDAFGLLKAEMNPSLDNDVTFTGREFSRSTTLMYYRARYYWPLIGRFTREDPRETFGYEYVGNNPLAFVDPEGLSREIVVFGYRFQDSMAKIHLLKCAGYFAKLSLVLVNIGVASQLPINDPVRAGMVGAVAGSISADLLKELWPSSVLSCVKALTWRHIPPGLWSR